MLADRQELDVGEAHPGQRPERRVVDVAWKKPNIIIPKDRSVADMKAGIAPTFVPGRNAVFLALAFTPLMVMGFVEGTWHVCVV